MRDGGADLVTYAQSWHWLDPVASVAEARRALREEARSPPGGTRPTRARPTGWPPTRCAWPSRAPPTGAPRCPSGGCRRSPPPCGSRSAGCTGPAWWPSRSSCSTCAPTPTWPP
ncbi:class I SAM-dependent methyltransferase [Nonomuraea recticatena]|uniref:hypothetical protein n=1 Tax=Nonomuraea recticatena TaxID=46178 RepID=UPI0036134687